MAKIKGAIVVDLERCKGCVLCVTVCPTNVIEMSENVNGKGFNYAYPVRHSACIGCTSCALVCPDMIITVYRYKPQKSK